MKPIAIPVTISHSSSRATNTNNKNNNYNSSTNDFHPRDGTIGNTSLFLIVLNIYSSTNDIVESVFCFWPLSCWRTFVKRLYVQHNNATVSSYNQCILCYVGIHFALFVITIVSKLLVIFQKWVYLKRELFKFNQFKFIIIALIDIIITIKYSDGKHLDLIRIVTTKSHQSDVASIGTFHRCINRERIKMI